MLGAIIGDIVGSRFEFDNIYKTDFELFTSDCAFTDDSICTIAVADAIIRDEEIGKVLHEWCRRYLIALRFIAAFYPGKFYTNGAGAIPIQRVVTEAPLPVGYIQTAPNPMVALVMVLPCAYHLADGSQLEKMP